MKKRLLTSNMILLSFIAGWPACSPSPYRKGSIRISARDLIATFSKKETPFDRAYLNKVISVGGIIEKIKKNDDHIVLYLGNNPDKGPSVSCSLDSGLYTAAVPALQVGDSVNLQGVYAGRLMDIILLQCIIENN